MFFYCFRKATPWPGHAFITMCLYVFNFHQSRKLTNPPYIMKTSSTTRLFTFRMLLILLTALTLPNLSPAQVFIQTPNPPYNGNVTTANPRNFITFVIENANNEPYNLTEVWAMVIP